MPDPVTVATAVVACWLALRYTLIWARLWAAPQRLAADRERDLAASERFAGDNPPELVFIVPAYAEADTLPDSVPALCRSIEAGQYPARIIVVTSLAERAAPEQVPVGAGGHGHGPTARVARRLAAEYPQVTHLEHDGPRPNMAAQFNAGVAAVRAQAGERAGRTYLVCYNADTTAAADTVQALGDTLTATGLPPVAQLMCVSLRNLDRLRGRWAWYLAGAAYYQTRWALGFEFDMYRRNSRRGGAYYLRGHGLTVRLDLLSRLDGLSSRTALEDLLLGFRLSLRAIPVQVVPVVENTDTPTTVRELLAQKSNWFSGMWDVLRYRRLLGAEAAEFGARFHLLRLVSLYRDVASWLLGPLAGLWLLVCGFFGGWPWLAALPVANAVLSVLLVRRAARAAGLDAAVPGVGSLALSAGTLAYSLSRNLGPLQHLTRQLRKWFTA
ncbi:glycosyltransferase [Crossiella cryophila]|uniref:4,4'-diaponeurosporenoate glycosyltransferase n=1 Tax=Crossiella cryophila TaxID=43355 RepID=A0A7W7FU21_9PSEU|nr:glycosyltransferase family 2 protein [Crossiella cryophila]MBB4678786.1 cellulose synthase/poly-beta-1,6-N-acetylglucosamine synthase-like glycosyltransferase [Crossiella cryophila]